MGARGLPLLGVPLMGGGAFARYLQQQIDASAAQGGGLMYGFQEPVGSTAYVYNTALAEGRQLALRTYAAYTAGAGWSNPSAQLATHAAAGGTATLSQAGLLAVGRTYKLVTIVSGRTAGSVTPTGGVAIAVDGTNTQTITATGTALTYTPTTDFDGTIDCATVALTQTGILASSAYPGAERLNTSGDGTADADNWTPDRAATVTNPSVNLLRLARNGVDNPQLSEAVTTIGKRYRFRAEYRGDGTAAPRLRDGTAGPVLVTGSTSTAWQDADITYTATTGVAALGAVVTTGTNYVEFRNISVTEVNPLNATNTGMTIARSAGARLKYAYLADGANDDVNVYSASFNSYFNPLAGTLNILATMAAGGWVDGTVRSWFYMGVDANNYVKIGRTITNNQVAFIYAAGGTTKAAAGIYADSGWFMLTMSWDTVADEIRIYHNGAQTGPTATGLGTWVGNLSSTTTVIGAESTVPTAVASGLLAYPTLFRSALTPAQILSIAQHAGVA